MRKILIFALAVCIPSAVFAFGLTGTEFDGKRNGMIVGFNLGFNNTSFAHQKAHFPTRMSCSLPQEDRTGYNAGFLFGYAPVDRFIFAFSYERSDWERLLSSKFSGSLRTEMTSIETIFFFRSRAPSPFISGKLGVFSVYENVWVDPPVTLAHKLYPLSGEAGGVGGGFEVFHNVIIKGEAIWSRPRETIEWVPAGEKVNVFSKSFSLIFSLSLLLY